MLVLQPHSSPQASELLRELCMKNMVWKYCRSISPEWKQQVCRAGRGASQGLGPRTREVLVVSPGHL